MSLDGMILYVSQLCARRGVSVYTIARRNKWEDGAARALLRHERAPTPKMLKDLARELDVRDDDLRSSLDR